jgi:hypothetical protein
MKLLIPAQKMCRNFFATNARIFFKFKSTQSLLFRRNLDNEDKWILKFLKK